MTKVYAKIVKRRGDIFPFRNGNYFDCREHGFGYVRAGIGRGAIVLDNRKGLMLNIGTGEVYTDERFKEQTP